MVVSADRSFVFITVLQAYTIAIRPCRRLCTKPLVTLAPADVKVHAAAAVQMYELAHRGRLTKQAANAAKSSNQRSVELKE
jgi:hypothetical protein